MFVIRERLYACPVVLAPKDSFILLQFNHSCSITHPTRSNLCQMKFKIVQLSARRMEIDWVKTQFDDHAFYNFPKPMLCCTKFNLLNLTEHCAATWFLFTQHAKFQSKSQSRGVLGKMYQNIIFTVDSEALPSNAS
jgi:hypothetical protein